MNKCFTLLLIKTRISVKSVTMNLTASAPLRINEIYSVYLLLKCLFSGSINVLTNLTSAYYSIKKPTTTKTKTQKIPKIRSRKLVAFSCCLLYGRVVVSFLWTYALYLLIVTFFCGPCIRDVVIYLDVLLSLFL